jgi:hypothetical protein
VGPNSLYTCRTLIKNSSAFPVQATLIKIAHSGEISDPWDGPRHFAQDYYSGGDRIDATATADQLNDMDVLASDTQIGTDVLLDHPENDEFIIDDREGMIRYFAYSYVQSLNFPQNRPSMVLMKRHYLQKLWTHGMVLKYLLKISTRVEIISTRQRRRPIIFQKWMQRARTKSLKPVRPCHASLFPRFGISVSHEHVK